jgi:myo-inositol-1(or 4)-monophosphatase
MNIIKHPSELNQKLLELALQIVHKTADTISQFLDPEIVGYKSSNTNLVSSADKAGEAMITEILRAHRPDDGLLGEEGSNYPSLSGFRWVFDPVDGTTNYLYRIPHWCISIACEKFNGSEWQPVIGVVHDAIRKETFSAIHGKGAFLNGTKISVNHPKELSEALIATEFSYSSEKRVQQVEVLSSLLPLIRDIRSSGSSALDLCWVALGRWDAFYDDDLSPWDWAAGNLIVAEAGGTVSPLGTGVLASSPDLHKELYTSVTNSYKKG